MVWVSKCVSSLMKDMNDLTHIVQECLFAIFKITPVILYLLTITELICSHILIYLSTFPFLKLAMMTALMMMMMVKILKEEKIVKPVMIIKMVKIDQRSGKE